jgi:tRNA pseudouridine55 synthase
LPVEVGLDDLPRVTCNEIAATRLRNGNPAPVVASDVEFGAECWASCKGQPVAIGRYRAGTLDPLRVFNLPQQETKE